jgi:hypothetical protein
MVLRRIFGPKKEEETGEDYIRRSFLTCIYTPRQILLLGTTKECWVG